MKEHEVNKRIIKKINESKLDESIMVFLLKILDIELKEGRYSTRYSKLYNEEVDKTYLLIKRGQR